MTRIPARAGLFGVCAFFLLSSPHAAQRTFVSTGGSDANACSLVAPCRGFAKAITVTDPEGEIIALDSGGYGSVIVNKNVTIVSPAGVYAGISVFAATDGITVAAPATKVVLRGLTVNGQGGTHGVRIQSGEVHVESTIISNMGQAGIRVEGGTSVRISNSVSRSNVDGLRVVPGAGTVSVLVRDSEFSNNTTAGIGVSPSAGGASAQVTVERSSLTKNGAGVVTGPGASASATVIVIQSVASENAGAGISSSGSTSTVFVRESAITRNGTGLLQASSGVLNACGANLLVANTTPQSGAILTSSCLDVAAATGTVTSITAGTGLTGGTITGVGTLGIANGGVGNTQLANASVDVGKLNTTSTDGRYFKQGGNALGATATIGTADNNALDILVNNSRVMRYEPNAVSPNVIGGSPANNVTAGVRGATIAGGGIPSGDSDPDLTLEAPNRVTDAYGTVSGGYANRAGNDSGTTIDGGFATVGGGQFNVASGADSVVAGGGLNIASGVRSIVPGGLLNKASGLGSWAGGTQAKTETADAVPIVHNGAFVWADDNGTDFRTVVAREFAVRATGGVRFVTAIDAFPGLPTGLFKIAPTGEVGINVAPATPLEATLVVRATSPALLLRGTAANTSSRLRFEEAPAANDCVGSYLFHDGSSNFFEIGVNNGINTGACTPADDIRALQIHRTTGRVGVLTAFAGPPTHPLTVGDSVSNGNGAHVTAAGVWTNGSSRAFKENFAPVDSRALLERVASLAIAEWSYRGEADRHVGPIAEDFKAAFGLGGDERYIGTVDADGVALVAIQGLNAKLEAKVAEQAREIAELRRVVNELLARGANDARVAISR